MQKVAKVAKRVTKIPSYHKIIFIDTTGEEIHTYSTFGKPDQKIKLEACPKSHPAWNKNSKNFINQKVDQVLKFNQKNKGFVDLIGNLMGE